MTGVDLAGIDAAIFLGVESGGWVPRFKFNEKGKIPEGYNCKETPHKDYKERTLWNVQDSDATLLFSYGKPTGGTELTIKYCQEYNKPYHYVDLVKYKLDEIKTTKSAVSWLKKTDPSILNIAGSRESKFPGIYTISRFIIIELLVKHNKIKIE